MDRSQTNPPHSVLRCCQCGRTYTDHRLACDECPHALLRTEYAAKRFLPTDDPGIFRFRHWLPAEGVFDTQIGPCVFQSEHYARNLKLKRLFLAFNGYWPEKGAFNITGSFKDHEAAPTIVYFREKGVAEMVISSVGNTARAFAQTCSETDFPCCIIVPERMFNRLWLPRAPAPCLRLLVLADSSDYTAAIRLGEKIRARFNVMIEGGARNVARRDGMSTSVLEYARLTGEMPMHYVQAIGSGTGGIAAYEAGLRLRDDGRFGDRLPRLHLVQNIPFTPIHEAWQQGLTHLAEPEPHDLQMKKVKEMYADVLANAYPPYGVVGGVHEALSTTGGETYGVTREGALRAKETFERLEGVSIIEPAACACAGLEQAVAKGAIRPSESVLLNITGGGYDLIRRDFPVQQLAPTRRVRDDEIDFEAMERYEDLFH
ncbi:MAG: cysteate synthase [Candidatus Tectimicrobiota bacterium]